MRLRSSIALCVIAASLAFGCVRESEGAPLQTEYTTQCAGQLENGSQFFYLATENAQGLSVTFPPGKHYVIGFSDGNKDGRISTNDDGVARREMTHAERISNRLFSIGDWEGTPKQDRYVARSDLPTESEVASTLKYVCDRYPERCDLARKNAIDMLTNIQLQRSFDRIYSSTLPQVLEIMNSEGCYEK